MNPSKGEVATSLASVLLSFLASSHHWLHMAVLMILGGSTNLMGTMESFLWLRRFMIVATLLTVAITMFRMSKHRPGWNPATILSSLSILISVGFIGYTLVQFGW